MASRVLFPTLLSLAIFLLGCATPYQPKGFLGGYEEVQVKPSVYFLEYSGNGYTSLTTVVRYWHWRANELCAAKGLDTEVLDAKGASEIAGIAGSAVITKPRYSHRGYIRLGYIRCVSSHGSTD